MEKCKSRLLSARAVHCFALGAQDVTLAALLQHQLLPSGIAINLCQDAALMRLTASTLNDDHLLLVLATTEANPVLQSATLQARTQGSDHYCSDAGTARPWRYGQRHPAAAR